MECTAPASGGGSNVEAARLGLQCTIQPFGCPGKACGAIRQLFARHRPLACRLRAAAMICPRASAAIRWSDMLAAGPRISPGRSGHRLPHAAGPNRPTTAGCRQPARLPGRAEQRRGRTGRAVLQCRRGRERLCSETACWRQHEAMPRRTIPGRSRRCDSLTHGPGEFFTIEFREAEGSQEACGGKGRIRRARFSHREKGALQGQCR